ncbi:MAG: DUF456 domain-containing protein [Longimicrobiales bacterium]|nr:DUF456 domain-containing protein [Longimicrobiales bacterium]
MSIWISILAVVAMLVGVAMIPLGLPGLWLIVAVTLGLVLAGEVAWGVGLVVTGVAVVAEGAELLVVSRFGRAYGGSRRAFWGAVIGGMLGLFVGIPVPVVGPVITAFAGTFLGAGAVTLLETRSLSRSARVGWGVVLARTAAVALKVGVSVGVIAAVGVAMLF